jgi:hypothetical protein
MNSSVRDDGRRRSSLRVAGVVPLNALRKQAFATALAPARKSSSAALGSHTCAKTVLAFTRSLRWLISAFHNRELAGLGSESAYTRGTVSIVNDAEGEHSDARPLHARRRCTRSRKRL